MNYQRTKQPSKYTTRIIATVVVILLLTRFIFPHAFASFFVGVFSPLWRFENFVIHSVVPEKQIVFSSDSTFASSTIAELLQENNDLKNLLGRSSTQNTVVAAVLSKPPFSAYDTLIVDAGSNQGIQAGDKVYALGYPVVYSTSADIVPSATTSTAITLTSSSSVPSIVVIASTTKSGKHKLLIASSSSVFASDTLSSSSSDPYVEIPLGQVSVTYGNTSVITLFSSPGQIYTVQIGSYHISASATANGGGMFEAMVPNNSNVVVGDPVIIPSIQAGVFASVVSVISDPARPYSLVIFQSPIDPFSLYTVGIEKTDVANNLVNSADHETK